MRLIIFSLFAFLTVFAAPTKGMAEEPAVHKWKMATSWPGGPLLESARSFAKRVEQMTEGRVKIRVFPGGALGNPLKASETVANGIAQAGHTWAGYDWGKDKATVIFCGWAGGPDSEEMFHWLYEGGGLELYQEYRRENFGLVVFPAGIDPPEIFMHSRKPVKTLEDLKGLKIRTTGAWLEVSRLLGAAPVTSSGAEVYQMLERGVVDALEWSNPHLNLPMGFDKIAPYIVIPGIHQPSAIIEVSINPEAWEELSEHDRLMVELASKLSTMEHWTEVGYGSAKAMKEFADSGNEIIEMDDEAKKEVLRVANEWADQEALENEWFARALNHQREFMKLWENGKAYREVR